MSERPLKEKRCYGRNNKHRVSLSDNGWKRFKTLGLTYDRPTPVITLPGHSSQGQTHFRLSHCDSRLPAQAQSADNHRMASPYRGNNFLSCWIPPQWTCFPQSTTLNFPS